MIELEGVTKAYGNLKALDALNLVIPAGQFFCFLGPNGAGKTTTIKLLCGLLRPDQGRVRVNGHDPGDDEPGLRRHLGYIPDQPYLYERLTVSETYRLVGDLYALPRARVRAGFEEDLDTFGLEPYVHTLVKDLSHGLRQRLVYAITFLRDPLVYLVDEPFVGLDPRGIRLMQSRLRAKARAGATIFLTTHILALIEELADRVGILHQGRLRALGALPELRQLAAGSQRLEDIFLELTADQPPAGTAPA